MERRLLVAVVLSILVMLIYPVFLAKINPPRDAMQLPEGKDVVKQYAESVKPKAIHTINTVLPQDAISKHLANDKYELTFTNVGGSIQKIKIKGRKGFDIDIVDKALYQAGIFAIDGEGSLSESFLQPFEIKKDRDSFYINYVGNNAIQIEKHVQFINDRYGLDVSIKLTNHSMSTQSLSFEITSASNISNKEIYEARYIEADVLYNNGKLKKIAGGNFKKSKRLYDNNIRWLALKNKYYSIIAMPDFMPNGVFTKAIDGVPVIGFIIDKESLSSGETKSYNFRVYIGPTEITELDKVDQSFGKALNFGMLTSISMILLSILKFFYSLLHNYGIAILLLTCCISFLLFPLTVKSMKSMRKLQELQPHIEKVRLQHKDNPHKLNKEIMEIYRRYNVNPMGGCFPMFLQMPIFIALYQTLMRSVELKGAGFLWIKDLSMPDSAFHLPFNLPLIGSTINILPILMIGAMIVQQKMSQIRTSTAQTEQQKMMGSIMPIVFGFIFYGLPSGLVLYWLTNTILTSSLQFLALKKA